MERGWFRCGFKSVVLRLSIVLCSFASSFGQDVLSVQGIQFTSAPLVPVPIQSGDVNQVRIDLSGKWSFNPAPREHFWEMRQTQPGWSTISVPGEWFMQGFAVEPNTSAGCWRSFTIPADWQGMRAVLRCDGIYSESIIWINGRAIGVHVGTQAFNYDVSRAIRPGYENTISVCIQNESDADKVSRSSQLAAHPLGGIARDIYLFAVPQVMLTNFHLVTRPGADGKWLVGSELEIVNRMDTPATGLSVRIEISRLDANSPDAVASQAVPVIKSLGDYDQFIEMPIQNPVTWDPEHPRLYTATCTLEKDGRVIETTSRRFGLRSVQVKGQDLLINSKQIKLRGVCRLEADLHRGRSTRPGLGKRDAQLLREANVNFVKTAMGPASEEFLDACDELGILVAAEAPICNAADIKLKHAALSEAAAMVWRDKSHPSVIIWSAGSEPSPAIAGPVAKLIRDLDPTRPILAPAGDIVSSHWPSPGDIDSFRAANTPVLFDQFAHISCFNRDELFTDPGLRDAWGQGLAAVWEKIHASPSALGGAVWACADDVFSPTDKIKIGFGEWGILDPQRREKPEYWHIKKTYSPFRIKRNRFDVPSPNEPLRIPVENRYSFANLSETKILWSTSRASGTAAIYCEPGSRGQLNIPWPGGTDTLSLIITDPRGFIADQYNLRIGPDFQVPNHKIMRIPVLDQNDSCWIVKQANRRWEINKQSGMISCGKLDGSDVITGGPYIVLTKASCENASLICSKPLAATGAIRQWTMQAMDVNHAPDSVTINIKARLDDSDGSLRYTFTNDTRLNIDYQFELSSANLREAGLAFDIKKDFDMLSWKRNAPWNIYPAGHIGRNLGKTRALGNWPDPNMAKGIWSQDCCELGTNDFRSTKHNLVWAALGDPNNAGVVVESDGRSALRCFVSGDHIKMLVNSCSQPSGDIYSSKHLLAPAQKPATMFKGDFYLRLTLNIPDLIELAQDDTVRKNP